MLFNQNVKDPKRTKGALKCKCGSVRYEVTIDPDDYGETVTEPYRQRQCLRLMKRIPELQLGPARGVASLYDVTVQDWYPIVDRTDRAGYYVCIGTSGASFKTAPVLGSLMAQSVTETEQGRDVDEEPIQLERIKPSTAFLLGTIGARPLGGRRGDLLQELRQPSKIGRASCRERV